MTPNKTTLFIPVENQVRELDAKLLLACIAARQGLPCVIGPKREMESRITSFASGIFLSKSLRIGKRKFFPIARQLGHEIVAWDEEALVHLPPETYFTRRLSPVGMEHISHLFAWGEDNAELWRQYPKLPDQIPIHVTGNPRGDLLRTETRAFYEKDAEKICQTYGNFILINTNFNHVNAFYPSQNLFQPVRKPGEKAKFGQAAKGMTLEYAEGLREHKQAIFEDFLRLIPALEKSLQNFSIVVRPHPTENQNVYREIAAGCQRVQVTNEGNVVPWLMATTALIHNGCTTGVEAYVMRVPAVSFRATVNDYYDDGFYQLPNRLSHQCFDFEELRDMLQSIISGDYGAAEGDEREALIDRHLAALEGPFACQRIVDVLVKIANNLSKLPQPALADRLAGRIKAAQRRMRQAYRSYLPGSFKSLKFQRHRYPAIAPVEVADRLSRFQQILGEEEQLNIEQIYDKLFLISA